MSFLFFIVAIIICQAYGFLFQSEAAQKSCIKIFKMSIYKNLSPINLEKIKTYELACRPSKVTAQDFAEPVSENDSLKEFLEKLPNILAVGSLREIAAQIRRA